MTLRLAQWARSAPGPCPTAQERLLGELSPKSVVALDDGREAGVPPPELLTVHAAGAVNPDAEFEDVGEEEPSPAMAASPRWRR